MGYHLSQVCLANGVTWKTAIKRSLVDRSQSSFFGVTPRWDRSTSTKDLMSHLTPNRSFQRGVNPGSQLYWYLQAYSSLAKQGNCTHRTSLLLLPLMSHWVYTLLATRHMAYCGQTWHRLQNQMAPMCSPSNTCFLWPTWLHITKSISIGSAVFAGLTVVTDRLTERPRYSISNNRLHLHSTAMRPNNN